MKITKLVKYVTELDDIILDEILNGQVVILRDELTAIEAVNFTETFINTLSKKVKKNAKTFELDKLHIHLDESERTSLFKYIHHNPDDHTQIPNTICSILDKYGLGKNTLVSKNTHFRMAIPSARIGSINAVPAHRDSWYRLPSQGINFWLACTNDPEAGIEIFTEQFGKKISKSNVNPETQHHEIKDKSILNNPPLVPDFKRGDIIIFSGEHLHRTKTNNTENTRISWDYRILRLKDLKASKVLLRLHEFVSAESFAGDPKDHSKQNKDTNKLLKKYSHSLTWSRLLTGAFPRLVIYFLMLEKKILIPINFISNKIKGKLNYD